MVPAARLAEVRREAPRRWALHEREGRVPRRALGERHAPGLGAQGRSGPEHPGDAALAGCGLERGGRSAIRVSRVEGLPSGSTRV